MWLIGIVYIIVGPLIALFGLQWFPFVVASLSAIFVTGVIFTACFTFGWMEDTTGAVLVPILAIILGVVTGILLRKNVRIMIGLLGLAGGFFAGGLLFSIIASFSDWNAVWGYWVISCVMATIGCVLSIYYGKTSVLMITAFVGSYLFMRSWTMFFPGDYPSEIEIVGGDFEIESVGIFWTYIAVLVVSFIGAVIFQVKRTHLIHPELENYKKEQH
jgi:hypothetical protein